MQNKPTKTSLKTLVRQAYKNRYVFDSVAIKKDGSITGYMLHYGKRIASKMGNISNCYTERTEALNIRLINGSNVVYTFSYDK